MAVRIVFEAHGTTRHNEEGLASGWNDVSLSKRGEKEAKELGERYPTGTIDAVFSSDLKRATQTAQIAFGKRVPVFSDWRLREIDYGQYTLLASDLVQAEKPHRVTRPFPGGESYAQSNARVLDFLAFLISKYNGKRVLLIGHRATQYALEHYLKQVPTRDAVSKPFKWRPGWAYEMKKGPRRH